MLPPIVRERESDAKGCVQALGVRGGFAFVCDARSSHERRGRTAVMSFHVLSVSAAARTAAGNTSASGGIRRCERLSAVETQERLSLLGKFHPTSHGCGAESTEECYGEILPGGYEQILQGMPPPGSPCALTPDSALYDIGSGFGRLVMYAAMRTNISHAVGIEVNACRHRGAVQGKASLESAAQRSSSSGSRSRRSSRSTGGNGHELTLLAGLEFVHGDVREQSLGDATHVMMSIQCWGHELIDKIISHLVPKAPRMRCMLFSAHAAKHVLSLPDGAILEKLDRWGVLDHVEQRVRSSWTEEMDVLYVGKRSPEADDWRRRHQVGKSVRLAPEGELDHLLPDMAADHRWKHVSGGSNANGNDAMRVLQVALACVAVLSVLVVIGYGLGVCGS
jgi:hypothetical protein